jgi:hypothetical protein
MSATRQSGALQAVKAVCSEKRLALVQLAGNVVLLALACAWLWVPDAKAWQVAFSAVLAVAFAAGVCWLHGATLAYFHARHRAQAQTLRQACGSVLARIPAIALCLFVLALALAAATWLDGRTESWAATAASWLTLKLQKPVSPESAVKVFGAVSWALRWILIPIVLLPLVARASFDGFAGLGRSGVRRACRVLRRPSVWLVYGAFLFTGLWIPGKLVSWKPEVAGLFAESVSFAIRLLIAYVLVVMLWLVFLSLLARDDESEALSSPEPAAAAPAVEPSPPAAEPLA